MIGRPGGLNGARGETKRDTGGGCTASHVVIVTPACSLAHPQAPTLAANRPQSAPQMAIMIVDSARRPESGGAMAIDLAAYKHDGRRCRRAR